ncbi:putative LRR containing protein [Trachipleistophora hominis]|uniref:Putative LRR containing protein n=1 Tax=Trachipleistophora hominis TaxID=72359 RepID=L7JWY8_TRAHO|nr:putative LRR containing protein [Trachipleistophora hominis]
MLSPSAQLTIIYIILFKNETRNSADNDYIITKDLKSVYLSSILDESLSNDKAEMNGFSITDYDIINDELDILHSKEMEEICIQPGPREQNQSASSVADKSMNYNPQYKLIKVPCTKALLNRVITLSDDLEELPSDTDITEILQYPILYSSNNILLYKFVQRYLKNFDFSEKSNFNLPAMYNKIESCTAYGFIDEKGNTAVTTSGGMKFFVAVHNKDIVGGKIMPSINYFACDVQYIRDNMSVMREKIFCGQNRGILSTIDIDFRTHICELLLEESKDIRSEALVTQKNVCIPSLLPDNFFEKIVVQKVVIWLCNAEIELNEFYLPVEEIVLHCHDSTIRITGDVPDNLTELYAQESFIGDRMTLHSKFKTLVLKDIKIESEAEVVINQECSVIELMNVFGGRIRVPFWEKHKEKFTMKSSCEFILWKNNDEFIEHLYISNMELHKNWDINENIKELELCNIISPRNAIIVINEDCKSLSLTKCKCRFSFLRIKLINKLRLQSRMTVERFVLNEEKKPSSYKPAEYHYHSNEEEAYGSIKEIHIKNTEPRGNDSIKIPNGCNKVALLNWLGTVDLENLGFGKLIIGMEKCTFNYEYKDAERLYFLSIEGGRIDWNSFRSNKRYNLHLNKVITSENSILNIGNNCITFTATNCQGHIKVPEILESECKSIRLDGENNFFYLKKLQNQKYFLEMSKIPVEDKLVFNDEIDTCVLIGIKVKENAEMRFKPDIVKFATYNSRISVNKAVVEDNNGPIKSRASDTGFVGSDNEILHVHKLYIEKNQSCKNVKILNLEMQKKLQDSESHINLKLENIYITNYSGKIFSQIFGPLTACLNFKNDGAFGFLKNHFVDEYIMQLQNCEIENGMTIRYDIKHLVLQKVTATHGIDGSQNDNTKWMDTFKIQGLRSLVLSDMKGFDYKRFTGLNYLQLENMTIEQNISFDEPIRILKLKNVTADNITVTINSSIEELHIQNCSGLFEIDQLFSILRKKENEKWIIQYKNQSDDKGMYLYLEGIKFNHNFNVPQSVKTLHLKNITMLDNLVLRIDQNCENIDIEEFLGIIETPEAKLFKNATFHSKLPIFIENTRNCSDNVETTWYFENDKEIIRLPNYLRTINLMNIEQGKSLELIIGEQCKELSLISCSCDFDLSEITHLRKLTFYPTPYSDINIELSHTIHVDELDIAYNGTGKYFRWFLVKCSSVKRLTIHAWNTDCQEFEIEKIKDIGMYGCTDIEKGRIENAYNKLVPHCDQDGEYSKQELLNTIMNILIKPIFYCRMRNTLESISLFEFRLDTANAKRLKNSFPLTNISIDYRMLDAVLLSNLPNNLRKLEIASDVGILTDRMKNRAIYKYEIKTLLSEQKEIEELTISLHFFREWKNLSFLPPNLKHLQITCFVFYAYNISAVDKKLNVKKLTIHRYRSMSQVIEQNEIMLKIYLLKIYDFLSQFIEIENLDELVVENTEGVIIKHTPSKYRERIN